MDPRAFDRLARAFSQAASRRRALGGLLGGALATMAGATVSAAQGRHHPGKHQGLLRGFRFTVINPSTNPRTYVATVEFGVVGTGPHLDDGLCCRREKATQVNAGEPTSFATPESSAYIWVDNKYFFSADNPFIGLPSFDLAINGVTSDFHNPACCKPVGQDVASDIALEVGETRELNFAGRDIRVTRQADDDQHKVYQIILDY